MTAPETPPGFARLIAAFKGVGQAVDWLTREDSAEKALPPAGVHCPEPPPSGWRCVLREPHLRCVLERKK